MQPASRRRDRLDATIEGSHASYSLDGSVWLEHPGGPRCSHAVRGGGTPFLTGRHTLSSKLREYAAIGHSAAW